MRFLGIPALLEHTIAGVQHRSVGPRLMTGRGTLELINTTEASKEGTCHLGYMKDEPQSTPTCSGISLNRC